MASFGSRKGAANGGSVVLMVLAFLGVGGFMVWLNIRAAETEVAVVEDTSGEAEDFGSAPVVDAGVFGSDPMAHSDGVVRINDLLVQSGVGAQAFFVEMPNQPGPYLIKMGARVVADSVTVPSGSRVSVVGRVFLMSDSVADDWVATGAIAEGDRILATFAQSFLEAVDIIVTAGGGDTDGGEGGDN